MIDASPFSSLDNATSYARQVWFKDSRIQSWLDAFSRHKHLTQAIGHAPTSMMKARYENTLVVELDIAAREEFKLIEHGLERLWGHKKDNFLAVDTQEASEEIEEVVPDSIEEEDVVSSDGSEEADSQGRKASMLSYDLNKTSEENEYPYSEMSPDKKNAWHLAMWATRYLKP
ncbi:uncharacterized protein DS421_4g128090 [Arachis hypogaea]|uniref:Oxo-4-hydroxy-4-carboxy-5-ureidoimidazoline decarboxylase domain-containing protein n=1 Tax=Arachis hypogaea TaxID=3818 RepID=A0A445DE62_ARAHY|nr:uncharacterized protein DS421_4g128090 [Arachis hypogaea]RYR61469.1 hypothetical protein Ahy_A04g018648 [Arachis hypogaea]